MIMDYRLIGSSYYCIPDVGARAYIIIRERARIQRRVNSGGDITNTHMMAIIIDGDDILL